MVKININKADGSPYWQETFNDRPSADQWLANEKTRPYWRADFVVNIDDRTVADQAAADALKTQSQTDLTARQQKAAALKALKGKVKTLADLQAFVDQLIDFMT